MTIRAKFAGRCNRCGGRVVAGDVVEWVRGAGVMHASEAICALSRPAQPEAVVRADGAPIVAFLTAARERGLKYPKARFLHAGDELRLSVAGERARVPGAVQVKRAGEWCGRINPDGGVVGDLRHDAALLATLERIARDPATAAAEYGALMGRCSFCDTRLTDEGSVNVGYGPVCAKRFGLPHEALGTRKLKELDETYDADGNCRRCGGGPSSGQLCACLEVAS